MSDTFEMQLQYHSDQELMLIRKWIEANASQWLVDSQIKDGIPLVWFYIKFDSPRETEWVQKASPKLVINATECSFNDVRRKYNSTSSILSMQAPSKLDPTQWKPWQTNIIRMLQMDMPLGSIWWGVQTKISNDYRRLLRHLSTNGTMVLDSKLSSVRAARSAIIEIPRGTTPAAEFFTLAHQLQLGIAPSVADPVNILIISEQLPPPSLAKCYDINTVSIL